MGLLTPEATLKQPGHPSSESSCFWGLVKGKGAADSLLMDLSFSKLSILSFTMRMGQHSYQKIFNLQYSLTSVGPMEWDTGQLLHELT